MKHCVNGSWRTVGRLAAAAFVVGALAADARIRRVSEDFRATFPRVGEEEEEERERERGERGERPDGAREHEDWWFRQRAFPAGKIPAAAYGAARARWSALATAQPKLPNGPPDPPGPPPAQGPKLEWKPIGPAPLATVGFGNSPNPNWSPAAGRIGAIAVHPTNPDVIYIGAGLGGVWKSMDRGDTWAPIADDQPSLSVSAIAIDPVAPETVYVGTGSGDLFAGYYGQGLLKSTDGGQTWSRPAGEKFASLSISRIFVDSEEGRLYLTTDFGGAGRGDSCTTTETDTPGQGLFTSIDGGETWTELVSATIVDLEVDTSVSPRRIFIDDLGAGVRISADGGGSWFGAEGLPANGERIEIGLSRADPSVVYAGVGGDGVGKLFVSIDHGETFNQITAAPNYCEWQCFYDNVVEVAPDDPGTVYLGGSVCSVWKVTGALGPDPQHSAVSLPNGDCGENHANWTKGYVHSDAHAIAFEPGNPQVVYVGSDGGLARTGNGGQSWKRLNTGVGTIQLYAHCVDQTDPEIYFAGAQDNGPMKRVDGTLTWHSITTGDGSGCAIDAGDPKWVLVADQYAAVFQSKDRFKTDFHYVFNTQGGEECKDLPGCGDRVAFIPPLCGHPTEPGTFYIGTYRLWRSTEGGTKESWKAISGDLTAGEGAVPCVTEGWGAWTDYLSAIGPAPGHPEVIYTGSAAGMVQVTWDGGENWEVVSKAPLPNRYLTAIAVDPTNPKHVWAAFSGFDKATPETPGHVFGSTDGGATWWVRDIGVDVPVNALIANPTLPGILYAGTDLGVLGSNDGGESWSVVGVGLPNSAVYSLGYRKITHALSAATFGRSAWEVAFQPEATVAPAMLSFQARFGEEAEPQLLTVGNAEKLGSELYAGVETKTDWLAVAPGTGKAWGTEVVRATVRPYAKGKSAGEYDGSVEVTALGKTTVVPVHLSITPPDTLWINPPAPQGVEAAGGCGCRAGRGGTEGSAIAMAAIAIAMVRRRRRVSS